MSKLVEELRKLPAFEEFEKALNKNLTLNNFYVKCFAPRRKGCVEAKDENGKQVYHCYTLTDEQRLEEGIEGLLEDKSDYIDEFVTDELHKEVVEFIRALILEMRK